MMTVLKRSTIEDNVIEVDMERSGLSSLRVIVSSVAKCRYMPTVWIDEAAEKILAKVKEELKEVGISKPSYSDAVHRIYNYYKSPDNR